MTPFVHAKILIMNRERNNFLDIRYEVFIIPSSFIFMVIFSNLQSLNVFGERLIHKYSDLDELRRTQIPKF